MTPASSRRCSRSATAGAERPTRRPSSASVRRASACSSSRRRRFVSSSAVLPLIRRHRCRFTCRLCLEPTRSAPRTLRVACDRVPATSLLRRQRRLPLPRPGVRRAAVRPRRGAGRGVAADRRRGARLRRCGGGPGGSARRRAPPPAAGRLGRGARGDELLLLPGHRPPAAGHRGGDRVPAGHRAGGARRAHARATSPRSRWRSRASTCSPGCSSTGEPLGVALRLRQRGAVRALHRARAPGRATRAS